MSDALHILVIGADPRLRDECHRAFAASAETAPVTHYAADPRQGVEIARSRRPALAVVEMSADLKPLRVLADELAAASPETRLVGAFKPEIFAHDVSESAVLIEALRAGAYDFLRRPVSAGDVRQLVERARQPMVAGAARSGRVATFISNKGGVGKSSLAVNTAVGLALHHPGRVLLVDASLQMGVCAAMLDLRPPLSLVDAARERDRLDGTLLEQLATPHVSGLHLLAAPADAVEGAEVNDEVVSRVLSLARRSYDYVIVDTFPMFDRVVMTVLDQSDRLYVVLENVVPTLLGFDRFLKVLASIGVPREKQRIIINRYERSSSGLLPVDAAERLGRDIDLVVPYDRKMIAAANLGQPFLMSRRPFSRTAARLRELVADVEHDLTPSHAPAAAAPGGTAPVDAGGPNAIESPAASNAESPAANGAAARAATLSDSPLARGAEASK